MHSIDIHKSIYIRKLLTYIVFLLSFFIILAPGFLFYHYHTKARLTLMDAKNIQLAMRVLSIQYYGKDRNVYVSGSEYGMAEDTIEEIKRLAGVEGDITLVSWNLADNVPGKFFYQTEQFLVIYEFEPLQKELMWNVYYVHPLMKLD